ncbi:hypothetical protein Agub_g10779 [Astrephomene gubernaculifera]|uniref:Uncharacterized protein n=1 Tax=Astrephomene gubernaculifera TaxID=47775 RepID=A0AAD3DZX8_9CHLO|nr:hypothetical protein Agub_g10779 [Astrephomene gubernaculifera]
MSATPNVTTKKRSMPETASPCGPASKKTAKDGVSWPTTTSASGIPGWQYPPLPMGMMPPMPFCMPGNPFFPFMGMFPPFWLPAAAMAAASMPALAAASAASSSVSGACMSAPSMWPMMPCGAMAPPAVAVSVAPNGFARTSSETSSAIAIPSASCTNSAPSSGIIQAPASPLPLATSPGSVCNGSVNHPPEDDEFASFIDSFLRSGDSDLTDAAITSGLKLFQPPSEAHNNNEAGEVVVETAGGLSRSDSQSLLNFLGADLELSGL